jgi:thymidylate synthase (FAD)
MSAVVQLVAKPSIDLDATQTYLSSQGFVWSVSDRASMPDQLVEFAGRLCKMSFDDLGTYDHTQEFVANILLQEHESILEHLCWTFLIWGVSRSFSHQVVRHHVGFSFSQLSQEYSDHRNAHFVKPSILAEMPSASKVFEHAVETAKEAYVQIQEELCQNKDRVRARTGRQSVDDIIRSVARSVLPNATDTAILMTANARSLRHFLRLRGGQRASEEMRQVCAALLSILKVEAPMIFGDFLEHDLPDGTPLVEQPR